MEKQKQIEEMAKTIDGVWHTHSHCPFDKKCPYLGGESRFDCNDCMRAYTLYNAGYRKIPEGAVVLTREENEKLKSLANDHCTYCHLMDLPDFESERMIRDDTRKETAEKFAEMVSKAFIGLNCIDIDEWNWCQKKIDEICKEITEGKV